MMSAWRDRSSLDSPVEEAGFELVVSPVEGNGFELSVPRCPADSAGAFMRRRVGSLSRRNRSIAFAEADDCSDDTAAPTVDRPQTRTKPRIRYLSRAELKVRIHSPPAASRTGLHRLRAAPALCCDKSKLCCGAQKRDDSHLAPREVRAISGKIVIHMTVR